MVEMTENRAWAEDLCNRAVMAERERCAKIARRISVESNSTNDVWNRAWWTAAHKILNEIEGERPGVPLPEALA